MVKVITYGTYDLLHYGHIRLLERAKELGDYLIVGVTSDDFDKSRGKINVQQSLMERLEAVRATGIADMVIVEEYEGQKIDDILKYHADIFTVGSDWVGKFDYLNDYCRVVYLDRTEGISSTQIRSDTQQIRIGLIGDTNNVRKFFYEAKFVNGISVTHICSDHYDEKLDSDIQYYSSNDYVKMIEQVDAVYIASLPDHHYHQIRYAIENGKHVLCEAPITITPEAYNELKNLAEQKSCVLMDAIKTAYSTAYARLILLLRSGKIGKVISVDATCTSMRDFSYINPQDNTGKWNSICDWGPTALLPVFQILGTEYLQKHITTAFCPGLNRFDIFTKIEFLYENATASIKVGKGVKSEGELVVSGTEGYIYVPAPWWKTDYFEVRYEDLEKNKRYYYQLDGEGIRYEIVSFMNAIRRGYVSNSISKEISAEICSIIRDFNSGTDVTELII